MPMLQRLAWLAFQCGIVGFFVWVDFEGGRTGERPSTPGLALALGIGVAYALTLTLSVFLDFPRALRGWLKDRRDRSRGGAAYQSRLDGRDRPQEPSRLPSERRRA